jgi:hypothetical protein
MMDHTSYWARLFEARLVNRFISLAAWGFVLLLTAPVNGGAQTRPLVIAFSAQEKSFLVATDEYRAM